MRVQVVWGVFLHQTRLSPLPQTRSQGRFEKLVSARHRLQPQAVWTQQSNHARSVSPYATDAMFDPSSRLFEPSIGSRARAGSFYNTSAHAGDIGPRGVPYGFFHRPIAGLPRGFPVAFEVRLVSATHSNFCLRMTLQCADLLFVYHSILLLCCWSIVDTG
jgi:hypothetical protein